MQETCETSQLSSVTVAIEDTELIHRVGSRVEKKFVIILSQVCLEGRWSKMSARDTACEAEKSSVDDER